MKMMTSLAKSRLKYNKNRTILTAIAILLTTTLLAGLGTTVLAIVDMQRQTAVAISNTHATFSRLTKEQTDKLKNHMDLEAAEASEVFATVEYDKMNGFLTCSETLRGEIKKGFGNLVEGHLPQKADEICGPKAFFERMGTEPVIGNPISISFRPNGRGKIVTKEFTICGLVSERELTYFDISDSRIVYGAEISKALVDEYLSEEEQTYTVQLRAFGEEELNYDEMEARIEGIAADIGCRHEHVKLNAAYLNTMTNIGSEMVGGVLSIALMIIIFSGLAIYSIYYVSVITDVQEIGKLKALGASQKQVKQMLLSEGMGISGAVIPVGLFLGYIIPYFVFPLVADAVSKESLYAIEIEKYHMFSLPVLLLAAAVVLLTVYISLLKPMRMAGKISPVEAIRYQESSRGGKLRKGKSNVNVFRLSMANLTGNRRRTVVTILTMGLGCVLFMSLAGVLSSFRAEDIARRNISQGDFRLELDGDWNDREYPENNIDSLQTQNFFSEEFLKGIRDINGVTDVKETGYVLASSEYPSELFKDGCRINLSYFTRADSRKWKGQIRHGELDYEKMLEENGAVFTSDIFLDEYGITIGDTIPLVIYDGDRQIPFEVKVTASMDLGEGGYFLIPEETYEKIGLQVNDTTDIFVYADEKAYGEVKVRMQEIADANEHFTLYSMDEEMRIGKASVNFTKYPVYVILGIIAVIGFMNLINTMVTGIVTRKRELGILQAIGLSDGQLTKMLAGEGMIFITGTIFLALTLGNILGYLAFLYAKDTHIFSVSSYHYPVWETIGLTAMLVLGQLFVTYFINKRVHRESMIDRIRSGE